jgi:hypothetical protein
VGVAPLQWLNAQRVMYAQRMLESTDLAMDQIAIRSGFGSLVAMRGHFRRMLSTSPTAYRSGFRTTPSDRPAAADGSYPADDAKEDADELAEVEDAEELAETEDPSAGPSDGQSDGQSDGPRVPRQPGVGERAVDG